MSRLPEPPQCVEVAAVMKETTIAPPQELVPLVEGTFRESCYSDHLCEEDASIIQPHAKYNYFATKVFQASF